MYNENSKKNLKPFSSKHQPPKRGRPKGSLSVINSIKKVLEGTDEKSQRQIIDLLAIAAVQHAMKGNAAYFKLITEHLDGKVPDKPEHHGTDGKPIRFHVSYVDESKKEDNE